MQVQYQTNFNYTQNQKSFGAKQLETLNLLKKVKPDVYTPIKATFSELNVNNKEDKALINKIKKEWKGLTEYGTEICDGFLKKVKGARFFITEAIDGTKKKITNIMQVQMPKPGSYGNGFDLKYMQSAPDIANKCGESPIKGSGETALYGLIKQCKKEGRNRISFYSTADRFYDKIGMTNLGSVDDLSMYGLGEKKFDWFLDRVAKKYNLNK